MVQRGHQAVRSECLGERDPARPHRSNRGAHRHGHANPVVPNLRAVAKPLRAEPIDDLAPVNRPAQSSNILDRDRRHVDLTALERRTPFPLQVRKQGRKICLRALEVGQSSRGDLLGLPHGCQNPLLLSFHLHEVLQFTVPVGPLDRHLIAHAQNVTAAVLHPHPQYLDLVGEAPVLSRHEVEVLVPAQQVAEALGSEENLKGPEWSPLVNLRQPPLEGGARFGQRILREDQLEGDRVELTGQGRKLAIELVYQSRSCGALSNEVLQLRRDIAGLTPYALECPFETVLFAPNRIKTTAPLANLPIEVPPLTGCSGGRQQHHRENEKPGRPGHTRLRCLPTLIALAPKPSSNPKTMTESAWMGVKNDASSTQRSTVKNAP